MKKKAEYEICQTCGSKVPREKKEVRYIWANAITNGLQYCHKNCKYLYPYGKKGHKCAVFGDVLPVENGKVVRSYKCECHEIDDPYCETDGD